MRLDYKGRTWTLKELKEKLPKSPWKHDDLYTALDTLCNWHGPKPSEFSICRPEQDLTFMAAYLEATRIMDRTNDEMQREEMEAEKRKMSAKGKT